MPITALRGSGGVNTSATNGTAGQLRWEDLGGGTLKIEGDSPAQCRIEGNRAVGKGGGIYLGKLNTGFFALSSV